MEPSSTAFAAKPSARTQPARPRTLPLPLLLPAVASAAMLWLCFHPLSWGWLGWVALVPLLCLVRSDAAPRRIYLTAWAAGVVFFLLAVRWMSAADQLPFPRWPMTGAWVTLSIYCGLYFAIAIYLTRVIERRTRLPLFLTFAAVWVALEYCRSFLMEGFAWYLLAHTQHEFLTIIQVSDLGGVFAVSFLVAAVNALVFDLLYQSAGVRRFLRLREPADGVRTFGDDWPELANLFFFTSWRRGILLDVVIMLALVASAYVYGGWRLRQQAVKQGPMVAMLQGNLDQRIRDKSHELAADAKVAAKQRRDEFIEIIRLIGSHYEALCNLAMRCERPPELIIWPETSNPAGFVDVAPEIPVEQLSEEWRFDVDINRMLLQKALKPLRTPQLIGTTTRYLHSDGKQRQYNSAVLLNADGQPEARFDKMHRVPFGEYVPLREWLPFMNYFAPYDHDYSVHRGEHFTRFKVGDFRFGSLICYEDTDPFLARHYVRPDADGPPVDFLVNISNDGWFDGTSEHEEHLAVSRFRAIECRRAMVRAVNMGISAVIDGNGRVLDVTLRDAEQMAEHNWPPLWEATQTATPLPHSQWSNYKKVSGVLVAIVPIDERFSLYALLGDWLAAGCWLLIGVATVGVWLYGRVYAKTT
jgi:apolipoprotein N-acyltransferase